MSNEQSALKTVWQKPSGYTLIVSRKVALAETEAGVRGASDAECRGKTRQAQRVAPSKFPNTRECGYSRGSSSKSGTRAALGKGWAVNTIK